MARKNGRTLAIAGVVAAVAVAGFCYIAFDNPTQLADIAQAPVTAAAPSQAQPQAQPTTSAPVVESDNPKDAPVEAPKAETVYKEVENDPHVTPPSLLNFAAELGAKLKEALHDESKAAPLFAELEQCALKDGKEANPSAQALCLDNARRLGTQYPKLSARFEELKEKSNPEIVRMSELVK